MEMNFLKPGDKTAQGNTIGSETCNWTVPQLWTQIQKDTGYADRKAAVEAYNATNRWTKKGLAISTSRWTMDGPTGWPVGAHISVYKDGTVTVCTGGIDIGQGLNTKVAMATAQRLGIHLDKVAVGDGDSKMLPNNGVTGGSGTSESCVTAVFEACDNIKQLLKPYGTDWNTAVSSAIKNGVNLVATGFNTAPWDRSDPDVNSSAYQVYGAGVSEVMLDVITGEVRLEKVDILMDLGTQLNP